MASPDRFARSFVLLIVLGTLACGWAIRFTDWFPEIGGALALGGVLSWLALVLKLPPEERIKHLQVRFDALLGHRWTPRILLGIIGSGFLWTSCLGTIELDARREKADHTVHFGSQDEKGERLATGATIRNVRWIWPGQSGQKVHIRVDGYPANDFTVERWSVTPVQLPEDLLSGRHVVLVRPSVEVSVALQGTSVPLRVRWKASGDWVSAVVKEYRGEAIWIGCDASVEVPSALFERWSNEVAADNRSLVMAAWSHPLALAGEPWPLQPGDPIEVVIGSEGQVPVAQRSFQVERSDQFDQFPQVEVISSL
jgi:hypothetical protein